MIKAGTLCTWQNCIGSKAYLNGSDCTALSNLHFHSVYVGHGETGDKLCYLTDTHYITPESRRKVQLAALPHELREKNPPQDETNLIEEKELEHG